VVGFTVIDVPVPMYVPPQLAEYHFHEAPVPSEPPCGVRVVLCPAQMGFAVAEMPVGVVDRDFTTMGRLAQGVVLQSPSALTK
jgi:hypothetical protein